MQRKQGIYEKYVKRILDILFSMLFLILFWWLILVIALLVKIKLGSPVIFKQPRPGKYEKIFNMYKFRTMTDERDANGELLPDDRRLTKFGNFLRKTSCDELLEIFNILKGDMSFIGPRPWITEYSKYFTEEQMHRLDVLPGMTGLAQCEGRNGISITEKINFDLKYVKDISLKMDLYVIYKTIYTVFSAKNAVGNKDIIKNELEDLKKQFNKKDNDIQKSKKKIINEEVEKEEIGEEVYA